MSGSTPASSFQNAVRLTKAELEADFRHATNSVLAGGISKSYTKRVALLMHYEEDDIGVDGMENELAKTFRQWYNIETRHIVFERNTSPKIHLVKALMDLHNTGYAEKDCLIILVFSGHGESGPNSDHPPSPFRTVPFKLTLYGAIDFSTKPPKPLTEPLDWVAATSVFDGLGCEVLHILDCCYAVEAMKADAEVLAAGTETVSSSVDNCFTKALIQELKRMSSDSFTIATLYEAIRNNRLTHNLDYLPFYNKPRGKNAVILRNQAIKTKPKILSQPKTGSRILLTAHLDRTVDQKAVVDIKEWLFTLMPSQAKGLDIKLEGSWDSTSSLLLFSLPVSIWIQLDRNNNAYNYVGEVKSGNRLLAPSAQAGVLALRPAAGPENTKPGYQFTG